MTMISRSTVLLLCAGLAVGVRWEQQELPSSSYPLAMCNDGTQANYYHDQGYSDGKILITLQGGGKCDSVQSCHRRCNQSQPELCTAQTDLQMEVEKPFRDGVNPWQDYWHVFVHYCSSDTWSGTREAADETGGYNFFGRHIFKAVIEDLAANYHLLDSTHIVLTGGSAGAQGTTWNCDFFAEWVWDQNPDIDVRCMPDAPEYYPPQVFTEGCYSRDPEYQNNLGKFWARIEDESCLKFAEENNVENVGELCGVTANFVKFITTPMLILSSHEDSVFTNAFGCAPKYGTPEYQEFRTEWMKAHSQQVLDLMADYPEIAFYAPNCREHGIGMGENITVRENESGELIQPGAFVSKWMAGDGNQPLHANDDVFEENLSC